jgi:hypothetical protein
VGGRVVVLLLLVVVGVLVLASPSSKDTWGFHPSVFISEPSIQYLRWVYKIRYAFR